MWASCGKEKRSLTVWTSDVKGVVAARESVILRVEAMPRACWRVTLTVWDMLVAVWVGDREPTRGRGSTQEASQGAQVTRQ